MSVNQRGNFLPILGILIVLVVGIMTYFAMHQFNTESNQVVNENVYPVSSNNPSWKTESIRLKREYQVNGNDANEDVTLSFDIPSEWKVKTENISYDSNFIIKDCKSYTLNNGDSTISITINPICSNWTPEYFDKTEDFVQLKENSGTNLLRHYDKFTKSHIYVQADATKVTSAVLIPFKSKISSDYFIPVDVSVYAPENTEQSLAVTDKIISSIKAQ